ncbi:MAG TPA: lamin tail domain-containing protein [Polyangiaceae bacterium]
MRTYLLWACCLSACGPDWSLPQRGDTATETVVEPAGSLSDAPQVLRLRIEGALGRSALADFRLFRDELSDYHLGRIRSRELPGTLLAREIPAVIWAEPPAVMVAPAGALPSGRYSLATPELGLITSIDVGPALSPPPLERLWPPRENTSGSGLALFCGEAALLVEPETVVLAPAGVPAEVRPGLDERAFLSERCVRLDWSVETVPSGTLVLPPLGGGAAIFEPLPLLVTPAAHEAPRCDPTELVAGPACARVEDDRVTLRAPNAPVLFALEQPAELLGVAAPGASLSVRGLVPEKTARIAGQAFDVAGDITRLDLGITAAPRRDHLVINEVLADPAGAETSSEWIELLNDGTAPVELAGFELVDSGGTFALPPGSVAPGELVVLVGARFAPDSELDVPLLPGTRTFVLDSLGKSGLANAGELLRLVNAEGAVVSRWPSSPAPGPGQSLARRAPDAPDGEGASFGAHAQPGASPGAPNELAPPAT